MDLRSSCLPLRATLAGALTLLATGCGSDTPFEYTSQALQLPGTLKDALPLATQVAQSVYANAFLTRLGGGLAVLDEHGRGWDHSFTFHAHEGTLVKKVTVNLVHGTPWFKVESVPPGPHPFIHPESDLSLDSDQVVERAAQLAPLYGLAVPAHFAARLSSAPVYPEATRDVIAWRVDLLTHVAMQEGYFSYAHFYFDTATADQLGSPVIPPQPELPPP